MKEFQYYESVNGFERLRSVRTLETQVAGHEGILQKEGGKLLKPVQPPPKGKREKEFYIQLFSSSDPTDIYFRSLLPNFYGIEEIRFLHGGPSREYIALDDIASGFSKPNIMDVKIGRRTWGPGATLKKQKEEDSKYRGTKYPFGFSIVSMIVNSIADDNVSKIYDKSFGKELATKDVQCVPRIFFEVSRSGCITALIDTVISKLESILNFFTHQRKYELRASSLLIAYDACCVRNYLSNRNMDLLRMGVNVRVIDFAHITSSDGKLDENFIHGLTNLIQLFKDCSSQEQTPFVLEI